MSNAVLILGDSGSGKSTSIRTLDPAETFVINSVNKPLPFKGARSKYVRKEGTGNYYATDNYKIICNLIEHVDKQRLEIKNIVLDDFQYIMSNEFMHRVSEKGYERFNEIAAHSFHIFEKICGTAKNELRDDLDIFCLSHCEFGDDGKYKMKTIGKMVDNLMVPEGRFTVVLYTLIIDEKYGFLTNTHGPYIAKSPGGMFPSKHIDNDLAMVKKYINDYLTEDITK